MGTEPKTQGSSGGPVDRFRKISKPLMEKKRRARINVSLEQLKSLLEKHYSHQIRKRKLEKADILELSVKYMKSLQNSVQGFWWVSSEAEYPPGFRDCLPGVSQFLRHREEGGESLRCPLVQERAVDSTMDSVSPGTKGLGAGILGYASFPGPPGGQPALAPAPQQRGGGKVAVGSGAEQTPRSEENRCPAPVHSTGWGRPVPTGTKHAGPAPRAEGPLATPTFKLFGFQGSHPFLTQRCTPAACARSKACPSKMHIPELPLLRSLLGALASPREMLLSPPRPPTLGPAQGRPS